MKKTYSLTNTVVKEKVTLEKAMEAQSWSRIYVYSLFDLGLRWEWMVNATTRPLYSREKDRTLSGQVRNVSTPPGCDSQTVQPVANRYTD
jgi:hypothetical protein